MPIEKTNLNLSALQNIPAPSFNIAESLDGLLQQMKQSAISITGGYNGLITLGGFFIFLYWILSEQSEYSDFGYSSIRAIGIACTVCTLLGLFMLKLGYFSNLYHVYIFAGITIVTTIWVWFEER